MSSAEGRGQRGGAAVIERELRERCDEAMPVELPRDCEAAHQAAPFAGVEGVENDEPRRAASNDSAREESR